MFNKTQRIPTESLLPIIQMDMATIGEVLSVKWAANGLTGPRFAIIVSKSVSKYAIKRHLIKRRISHLITNNIGKFKNKDYVIFVRAKALGLTFAELEQKFISFINENEL